MRRDKPNPRKQKMVEKEVDVRHMSSKEAKLRNYIGCGGESVEGVEDVSALGNWRYHSLNQKEH